MGRVDLDAVRAEAQEEPHEFIVGGVTYLLRSKLPPAVIEYLVPEGLDPQHPEQMETPPRFSEVARALLLDHTVDPMAFAAQLDDDEWKLLFDLYGMSLPGIVSLGRALIGDTGAVEADLAEHYGVDLADLYRGELSVRRLSVLVAQLPASSRCAARGAGYTMPWTIESEAIATVVDVLYALLRVTVAANSKRGTRLPDFTFPRPETPKPERVKPPPAGAVRGFAALDHKWSANG